jgi:hypothetical protein
VTFVTAGPAAAFGAAGFGATTATFATTGLGAIVFCATTFGAAALATTTCDAGAFAFVDFSTTPCATAGGCISFWLLAPTVLLLEVRSIGCGSTLCVAAESALAPVASAATVITKSE